jgi:hypothetical protein
MAPNGPLYKPIRPRFIDDSPDVQDLSMTPEEFLMSELNSDIPNPIPVESLESDTMFKKGFTDVEIFKKLVFDFTGVRLKIDEVENDKAFNKPVGKVRTQFDLFAEDKQNRIIVEAQHANYTDNFERFYYYHQVATRETIASSKDYAFPQTIYTLVFFTDRYSPALDKNILVHDAEMKYVVDGKVVEGVFPQKHRLFFIFAKDPEGDLDIPEECQEWIRAIHETLRESVCVNDYTNPQIKRLFERISKDKTSPEDYEKMKEEYRQKKAILDATKIAKNLNKKSQQEPE